ncbi:MAG: IPExxxVDY family protein, partial [Luteibaculum sp.]
MAIHYLDMEDEFDCDLLGIACHLNNYRMCWLINTALQSNLKRSEKPLQVWHSEDLSSQHTYYSGENTYWKSTLNLVQNKSKENRYLVPEKKVADYILIIRNPK